MSVSSGSDPNFVLTAPFPIAVVISRFNHTITDLMRDQALDRLRELGFPNHLVKVITVPGAVEIPLMAQVLAKTRRYQAIIALGVVIRGETNHFDYVCEQVSQGCQRVMLDFSLPVIFGVLTTENEAQASARVNGKHSYKGREAVDCACEMVSLLKTLS